MLKASTETRMPLFDDRLRTDNSNNIDIGRVGVCEKLGTRIASDGDAFREGVAELIVKQPVTTKQGRR